jgi:RNA polymerase sigma factor (sigma-70 family)
MSLARNPVVEQVCALIDRQRGQEQSDEELLERFATRRDEPAFAALVQRHGPLVLGVCRRVLGNSADADDAFQATFLTLACQVRSLRCPQALASWLYRVAYLASVRARRRKARRTAQESQAMSAARPDPETEITWRELGPILDEAMNRLPEKYRTALVLCGLQGKSAEKAAAELGCPIGSISHRLAKARDLLRRRLARSGFAVPAVLLGAIPTEQATAAVSSTLAETTVRHALLLAAGGAVQQEVLGIGVANLLQETMQAMLMNKLKIVGAFLLLLSAVGAAIGVGVSHWASPPGEAAVVAVAEPDTAPTPAPQPALRVDLHNDPLPAGALARLGTLRFRHGNDVRFASYCDQGKQLLTVTSSEGQHEGRYQGVCRLWDAATGRELRQFRIGDEFGAMAALSPDGKALAVIGHNSRALFLWETATGKLLARHARQPANETFFDSFGDVVFSPDSTILAAVGSDRVIRLFEAADGKEIRKIGKPARQRAFMLWPHTLAFSPDGKTLALSQSDPTNLVGGRGVQFWESATGKELPAFQEAAGQDHPSYQGSQLFTPDGQRLLRLRADGVLSLIDLKTGQEVRQFGESRKGNPRTGAAFACAAFSPDGKLLAAKEHSYSLGVRLWETATGKELANWQDPRNYGRLCPSDNLFFSPDGKTLGVVAGNSVRRWDVASSKEIASGNGHESRLDFLAVAPDGRSLLTHAEDSSVRHWDLNTSQERTQVRLPSWVRNLAATPHGRAVAFGGDNDMIHLWDAATGKEIRTFRPAGPDKPGRRGGEGGLAFSPDGTILAAKENPSPSKDIEPKIVRFWDVASGKELRQFSDASANGGFNDIGFSPDGSLLAVVGIKQVNEQKHAYSLRFWNAATGKFVREIQPQRGYFSSFAFSPDGRSVALNFNEDKAISLWEVSTGKERFRFPMAGASCLSFSPDGRFLAAGTWQDKGLQDRIVVWDVRTGKELGSFQGPRHTTKLAFTPDGQRLISASSDTTALVWDAAALTRGVTPAAAELDQQQLEAHWAELAGDDAARAWQAHCRMRSAALLALPFLRGQLKPDPAVEPARIKQWIAELQSEQFQARQQAAEALVKLGDLAEPYLHAALAEKPALDTRLRIEQVLDQLPGQPLSAETLRGVRAVEILEAVGTSEAQETLKKLRQGAKGARLTLEAQRALERLARSPLP